MGGHIELAVLSKGWRRDVPMSWTGLHTPNDGRLTAAFSLKGFNRRLFTCFFTTSTKHMSFSQEVCASNAPCSFLMITSLTALRRNT